MSLIDDYVTIDMRGQYSLNEIAVPTCSYRMGEKNIGFGVAVIGMYNNLRKFSDTLNICCSHPEILAKKFYHSLMLKK